MLLLKKLNTNVSVRHTICPTRFITVQFVNYILIPKSKDIDMSTKLVGKCGVPNNDQDYEANTIGLVPNNDQDYESNTIGLEITHIGSILHNYEGVLLT